MCIRVRYIAGALEIPGYSSYLHPISENLLVGIGQNVDLNRITTGTESTTTPILEGVKISLFDVSDITNPTEINSIVYEGGYSPVEFNYHALTYLKTSENTHRFGLPIERWATSVKTDSTTNEKITVWQQENFLSLIEISTVNSTPLLIEKGKVIPFKVGTEENYFHISSWEDRAVFHNNDVYYIHGPNVWKSDWMKPDQTPAKLMAEYMVAIAA